MRNNLSIFFAALLIILAVGCSSKQHQEEFKMPLTHFEMQSSAAVQKDGSALSSKPYAGKAYWFPVDVPSTVLTGLVANNVYPNPYIGLNNMLIPDASDSANKVLNLSQYSFLPNEKNPWKKPYWYKTSFKLPDDYNQARTWIHFKGINYRAAVWLNGHQLADSTDMVGMFRQYRFDISDYLKKDTTNYVAVKIYPLDYPGTPADPQLKALGPFYLNGGTTGDIGKNVTMQSSVGWDWMPAVRDRNMGIWQPVYLTGSGEVTIDEPQIVTELPNLPDTAKAGINLSMQLANHSDQKQDGELNIDISPKNFAGSSVHLNRDINLPAGQKKSISLQYKDIDQLRLQDPHLWWPNGYGNPNLYNLHLSYTVDGMQTNVKTIQFGIRQIGSTVTDVNGWARRDFFVNGQKIDLTGGAWVPDMMLNRDSLRYEQELELIKNGNMNTVRIWGGGIAPPDELFNQADRKGLLVWQDFWITGDANGGYKGSKKWPLQTDVFEANVRNTIKRLRNHPSLLVWTGGNENHPRKELYDAMRQSVANLDGTRPFISSSSGFAELPKQWKKSWPDNTKTGVYSGGPYSWQPPEEYYKLVNAGKDWVMKDEVGIPSQPTYSSLPKVIPNLVADSTNPYPFNSTWGYHDAASGNGKYETYFRAIKNRYGPLQSYRDYSQKAQLVNANGYRAIFESVGSELEKTGGVLLWKTNAAWPSVIWQLYDWYLNPNAGYYFTKRAIEPIHAQFNPTDSSAVIVNRTYKKKSDLTLTVSRYDKTMQLQARDTMSTAAPAHQSTTVTSLKKMLGAGNNRLNFLSVQLVNASGPQSMPNVYWVAPGNDFSAIESLPSVPLKVADVNIDASNNTCRIDLKNSTDKLAFFVHATVEKANGEEALPSYWSDNYFSLSPHSSRTLTVRLNDAPVKDQQLYLSIEGQNVPSQRISLGKVKK